ncbi:MAG: adenylate/guanylate cyclase domain-containing protein [Ignavibacteria bacterium]|nr:adenylate/guanylate cyclase domain-containing protein [Ignavibacteria bacterium]
MKEPTGKVTFLFTDIEGSTKLSQQFAESYPAALEKHNLILNKAVKSNNGFVFKTVGDAFCCAFQNADDAVIAACDIQKLLFNENWNEVVIKVRIGIPAECRMERRRLYGIYHACKSFESNVSG